MIEITYFFTIILITIIWVVCRAAVCLRKKKICWKREVMLLLFYICIIVIARFTFFPFSLAEGKIQPLIFDPSTAFPFRINLVPLVNLFDYPESMSDLLINVVGNTAMFIPLGIVLPVVFRRLDSFWKTVAAGALFSLSIEIIQLPFSVRVSDIDDLLLNTVGCCIGYGIFSLCRAVKRLSYRGKRL